METYERRLKMFQQTGIAGIHNKANRVLLDKLQEAQVHLHGFGQRSHGHSPKQSTQVPLSDSDIQGWVREKLSKCM
ncbi:hypothetical protein DSO57_1038108 [Entomophthora muscae]|uniref:Uncharacterized protein n=1 Tax=Entomophthora muscae TaxID=34485 RepID=A0ACC2TKU6_9FUNG|nr:hypothetical protein DSO57_1038108 [Entomophthora muscae]